MKDKVECCNAECGWKGPRSKALRWKHDTGAIICPECHEVCEPVSRPLIADLLTGRPFTIKVF